MDERPTAVLFSFCFFFSFKTLNFMSFLISNERPSKMSASSGMPQWLLRSVTSKPSCWPERGYFLAKINLFECHSETFHLECLSQDQVLVGGMCESSRWVGAWNAINVTFVLLALQLDLRPKSTGEISKQIAISKSIDSHNSRYSRGVNAPTNRANKWLTKNKC